VSCAQRCHHKQFLLKFARDRRRYLQWVFEAKKRFGLSVLNYVVTCNHIHLLVKDTGRDVISQKHPADRGTYRALTETSEGDIGAATAKKHKSGRALK
jgi:REP element-mobilizing transposase RayT